MNTHKILIRYLMAGAILALLFTSGCGMENVIHEPAGQALAEQGDAIMSCVQDGDFQEVYDLMSHDTQLVWNNAAHLVGSRAYLESLVMQGAQTVREWDFQRARIYTENGKIRGTLDGKVEYVGGENGHLRLEVEQENGVWKLRSFSLD